MHFQELDPFSCRGAISVAVELPYSRCGGAVRQLQKDRMPCLLSISQDPEFPKGRTLGDSRFYNKQGRRTSAPTVQALHIYRTAPPSLMKGISMPTNMAPPRLQGSS